MSDEELLRQRRIPPGMHYVSAEQSDLWRALAAAHSPAGEPSVQAAYAESFARVAEEFAGKALQLIALGAGCGEKEAQLVRLLKGKGCSLQISAVDVSESLARETVEKLSAEAGADTLARAVVGDFLTFDDRRFSADGIGSARLVTAFGLSPNVRPGEFFRGVSRLLRDGDRCLLSANLWPVGDRISAESEVLAQYDNPETRRWLGALFEQWGIAEDEIPTLEFSIGDFEAIAAVIATLKWPGRGVIPQGGAGPAPPVARQWRKGERIEVFSSLRYTLENFFVKAQQTGLSVQHSIASQCGREAVYSVLKSASSQG